MTAKRSPLNNRVVRSTPGEAERRTTTLKGSPYTAVGALFQSAFVVFLLPQVLPFVVFLLPQVLRTLRLLSEDAFSVFQPHRSYIFCSSAFSAVRPMIFCKKKQARFRSGSGPLVCGHRESLMIQLRITGLFIRSFALQMLIFAAVGFLDKPSVTLRDAERQIRQNARKREHPGGRGNILTVGGTS